MENTSCQVLNVFLKGTHYINDYVKTRFQPLLHEGIFCELIELSDRKSWSIGCSFTVRKSSLIIIKFQRKTLSGSQEHEEVLSNRCDQSKLQRANSLCFIRIRKCTLMLSSCFLIIGWDSRVLKKKLLNILSQEGKTTHHSKKLIKKAEIKATLFEKGIIRIGVLKPVCTGKKNSLSSKTLSCFFSFQYLQGELKLLGAFYHSCVLLQESTPVPGLPFLPLQTPVSFQLLTCEGG